MKKVLQIINRLNLGGPTFNAAYLSHYMAPDFETMLVAGMKDESEASSEFILEELGVRPHYVKHMHRAVNPLQDRKGYKEIVDLIRTFKPDIIHTHASKAGALGRLAGMAEKVPVIVHTFHGHVFHSYFGPLKSRFYLEVERYLARKSDAIIAISQQQKNELTVDFHLCEAKKIEIVHLGVDFNRFREDKAAKRARFRTKYGLEDDEIAIGIVGRLVPVKHHAFFLRAYKALQAKSKQRLRAFIVGDGESRQAIEASAREIGLDYITESDLVFTSWIKEVDEVVAGLDIVALSSLNEGTPVSLIEAQAGAKPIVSTRVGGVEDVVNPSVTAFLVDKTDEAGFTEALLKLTENPALREQMGRAGCDFVNQRFGIQKMIDDTATLYDKHLIANC